MRPKIKVCIADDNKAIRESVSSILKYLDNIEVLFGAANGQELLDQLKKSKPDVIILDIDMPVMDGVQALAKIKTDYPDIKVIMYSTHNESLFIKELFERGANSFLPKNCDLDEFENAINGVYHDGFYHTLHVAKLLKKIEK